MNQGEAGKRDRQWAQFPKTQFGRSRGYSTIAGDRLSVWWCGPQKGDGFARKPTTGSYRARDTRPFAIRAIASQATVLLPQTDR